MSTGSSHNMSVQRRQLSAALIRLQLSAALIRLLNSTYTDGLRTAVPPPFKYRILTISPVYETKNARRNECKVTDRQHG